MSVVVSLRRARRPFPFRRWTAGLAAVLGGGLLLGLPSRFVPDSVEPIVGGLFVAAALRLLWRGRRLR